MKLREAKIGKSYNVTDIQFCDDCKVEDQSCMILSLMEIFMKF